MAVCPLCNGYGVMNLQCSHCSDRLEDQGKVSDYFDDYSPYMEGEDWDFQKFTSQFHYDDESRCTHIFLCPTCGQEYIEYIPL